MTEQTPTQPAEEQVPVCPRHPDRESYVRCQRCGRPACWECQRPAAVGIQCVDCVREGAKTVRQGRTIFGGAVTDGRPVVTYAIIAICAVVWILQQAPGFGLTSDIAFVPALGDSEPWRFLTSAFAHGPIYHIAFNMYALWFMGQYLEPMLGRARFIALYLLSAVGGSVVYLLLAGRSTTYAEYLAQQGGTWWTSAVGASGAVFGLFGAYVVLQRRLNRSAGGMYVMIAINAVIGFVYPGIAWQAHLGGLVTGALATAAIAYAPRGRLRTPVQVGGMVVIAVALVVVTVIRYALAVAPV